MKEVLKMKKITALLMAALLGCSMMLTSCGGFDYAKEDLSKYIELGTYKGVSFEVTAPKAVDDAAIADYLKTDFADFVSPVEQDENYAAKEGDTVNISYVGKMNGEEFEGGSAENQDLELGSDRYIDGFEDGLIGAKKGEKKTLNLKVPTDYGNEELNGKDVTFEVTVNSVSISKYEYGKKITDDAALEAGDNAVITYTLKAGEFEDNGLSYKVVVGDENDEDLPKVCTDALVGLKVTDKDKEISVKIPDNFYNSEAAGKDGTFIVTVESATRNTVTDEIDDAMIASVTENATLAEYKEKVVIPELTEQFAEEAKTANMSGLWKKIIDGATVKSYPAGEVKDVAESIYNSIAGQIGNQYNLSMREYASMMGYKNAKEFKTEVCMPQAESLIKEKLVFNAIIKAENLSLTDDEKAAGLERYYEELDMSASYSTFEEFKTAIDNGEILVEVIYESILWEKVVDTLLATVTK